MPISDRSAPETKTKDQKRVEAARKSLENYMKKLKEKLLKDNQEAQMTLKEFIQYFQQDLNDPVSILIAIEETMHIMKEEHNTEINISIRGTDMCLSLRLPSAYLKVERKMEPIFEHPVFNSAREKLKRVIR